MTYYNICISYWKLMCHWSLLILLIRRLDMTCVPLKQFHLCSFTKHHNVLCLFSVPLLFIACSSSYIWLKSVNCELCCAHMLLLLWRSKTTWFYFIFINDLNRVAVIINNCDFAITTIVASIVIVREKRFFREWIKKMDTCNIAVNDWRCVKHNVYILACVWILQTCCTFR